MDANPYAPDDLIPFLLGKKPYLPYIPQNNWENFLEFARWNRIAPLFYHQLKQFDLQHHLPPGILTKFENIHKRAVYRSLQQEEAFLTLSRILQHANIPFMILKGLALGRTVYPHPACKPMVDIDLLLPPDKIHMAAQLLKSNGFVQEHHSESAFLEDLRHHLPPLRWKKTVFELHRHILSPSEKGQIAPGELFQHGSKINLLGREYTMLSPEYQILQALYHVFKHIQGGYLRLIWLMDLCFLIGKYAESVNFKHIQDLADQAGLPSEIWNSLFYLDQCKLLPENSSLDSLVAGLMKPDPAKLEVISNSMIPSSPSAHIKAFRYMVNLKGKQRWRYIFSKTFPSPSYVKEYVKNPWMNNFVGYYGKMYFLYLKKLLSRKSDL